MCSPFPSIISLQLGRLHDQPPADTLDPIVGYKPASHLASLTHNTRSTRCSGKQIVALDRAIQAPYTGSVVVPPLDPDVANIAASEALTGLVGAYDFELALIRLWLVAR